jgi:hypothetical protein
MARRSRMPVALDKFFRPLRTTMSTMDALSTYGALAVTAMLVFYALEPRSPVFVLAFACACLASSGYGFLQGAWPFGVVEFVWAGVALRRWWVRRRTFANYEHQA